MGLRRQGGQKTRNVGILHHGGNKSNGMVTYPLVKGVAYDY